jgi:PAT family beta-lactamase induction signal transducer AmpG
MPQELPRATRPAVFAVTILPYAAAVGYATIAAPYWLAQQGVSLATIGGISGTIMMPLAIRVFWSPIVDLGRRRLWFAGMTLITAASIAALSLIPDLAHHLGAFVALGTLSQVAASTSCAAADGLMAATTRVEDQGRAGGYRMTGNVGGTGIIGALALWISGRASVPMAGLAVAAIVLLSLLAVLAIEEPAAPPRADGVPWAHEAGKRLRAIARDLVHTLLSREGWTGLVICAVPVGAGALTNIFSAMAIDYHASQGVVASVNGLLGGLLGAAGAFLGGLLADRMNRRLAYALSGALIAGTAMAMMLGPTTERTYVWGTLAYNFATGISYTALAAFVLEMVGNSPAAATKYSAFISVANLASSYVTALDGWASEFRGWAARGALAADAALTVVGIGVLLAMVALTRRREKSDRPSSVKAASPGPS